MMNKSQGFALVTTLLITALVGTLIAGSLTLSVINRRISGNDALAAQTLNVAQAGSAFWKAELVSLYRFMLENPALYQDDITAYQANSDNPAISCDNYFAIGIDFNRDGNIDTANASTATKAVTTPGTGPKPLVPERTIPVGTANGTAQVSFYIDGSVVGLRSRGSFAGSRATIVEEFTLNQANIFNNAVFASSTAADATIQGRAEIRGSIHVLGEGANATDTVLDVSGNFALGNTYEALQASSVEADVTGADNYMRLTTQRPTDLCAALRVKNGRVEMGGSSKIGNLETTNPEPYKDLMSGIYTNDGFIGGVEGGNQANIFSKNGIGAKYDVGELYDFPDLTDLTDGLNYTTGTYPFPAQTKRWQDKIRDNSLVLSTNPSTASSNPTPDDRTTLPIFQGTNGGGNCNNGNGNNSCFTNVPGWSPAPGKTYLSAGCTTTALFGVNTNGTAAGGTTTATTFTLTQGTTPTFSCIKYRLISNSPNPAEDEIVTEVIWSGSAGGSKATSSGAIIFGANELYVGGKGGGVMFWGKDLTIGGGGKIGYYGNGVLVAEDSNRELPNVIGVTTGGNINLATDFTPATNDSWALLPNLVETGAGRGRIKMLGPSPAVKNTYPANALVSFIVRNQIRTDGSQRRISSTIYAQEEVKVVQQTVIAGSLVTKKFDAGSQVPTVLFVPNLTLNLSKLMPGAGSSTYSLSNTAWNRR